MSAERDGARLHDKATRGVTLSVEEQERLDAWYAAQDTAEQALLNQPAAATTDELRAQIAMAMGQLQAVTQRIHDLAARNAALREETTALQHQLARRTSSRVA